MNTEKKKKSITFKPFHKEYSTAYTVNIHFTITVQMYI